MATTQPAPAAVQHQQQPQLPTASSPSTAALDNLQAMINGVLIQSGHFLKDQANGGHSSRTRIALRRAVPAAISRFHQSLDDLQLEVNQAQMVLRRDLALLRAEREKRERAEADRARLAAASSMKTTSSEQPSAQAQQTPATIKAQNVTSKTETPQPESKPSVIKQEQKALPPNSTSPAPPSGPVFDTAPAPGTAQDSEFDFDAMFGDSLGDTAAGPDNANNNGASGGDLGFNLTDDSGGSLLRGLEDFAKSGDDAATANSVAGNADQAHSANNLDLGFSMPDLPELSSSNQPANQPPQQQTGGKPEDSASANQQEQSRSTNDGDVVMETDNLDDLFNLDYEPNPETTEFDDAFFGYGEN
ncbi:uncharacterized protein EI97DRAFT_492364 [Westerdykella ornata]|uniref:Uncharacterized protein n=1 Tax=Westerdykella ornata TaxID=318751 RepID=A0A6A6JQ30_WESOR|nr:uncharacterized protein EI97DRAFT_492364 [Westerdykella ornata]KAF2278642.1 hypothetical protein EI97DRAFT_492364 [Westerdykella ornata]